MSTRNKIVDSAAYFLERCHSTSFSSTDVSNHCGVSQPLIMYHFKTVDELIRNAFVKLKRENPEAYKKVYWRELSCERSRLDLDDVNLKEVG